MRELVDEIVAFAKPFDELARALKEALQKREDRTGSKAHLSSARYWSFVVYHDAIVRIRLFLDQNFVYIEPVALLGITRYLFEATVWLKLIESDDSYGLVYYRELLRTQERFYNDLKSHLDREAAMFSDLDLEESRLMKAGLESAAAEADPDKQATAASAATREVPARIDRIAARSFSLYGEQALTNGYGFQAHLIRSQAIPTAAAFAADIKLERDQLEARLPPPVKALIPSRWNWAQMADKVQLRQEYDFIYTYTSKLMHATPVSMTTDQKNLELAEIMMFLRYIRVRLADIADMAKRQVLLAA